MKSNAAEVLSVPVVSAMSVSWVSYVRAALKSNWREGEWNDETCIFVGDIDNPNTRIYRCATPGCHFVSETRSTRQCLRCRRILRKNGGDAEMLAKEVAARPDDFNRKGMAPRRCRLIKDEEQCQRQVFAKGLCSSHHSAWRVTWEPRGFSFEDFVALDRTKALREKARCRVLACDREQASVGLCAVHNAQYGAICRTLGDDAPTLRTFAAASLPILTRSQFSLAGLPEPMRSELLYALQSDDAAGYLIDPVLLRGTLADLWSAGESFLEPGFLERAVTYVNRGPFIQRAVIALRRLMHKFEETDPFEADVWDSYLVGMRTDTGRRGRDEADKLFVGQRSLIDFRSIRQPWLREIAKRWARDLLPTTGEALQTIGSFEVMSEVLANRTKGDDPTTAGTRDIRQWLQMLNTKTNKSGKLYGANWRATKLRQFRQALHYVRGLGELDYLPSGFNVTLDDRVRDRQRMASDSADRTSRGIPYRVVDAALAAIPKIEHSGRVLGSDLSRREQTDLMRAVLRVLIDTGRRPGEVCRLRLGCVRKSVEQIDPTTTNYELVYTNWKAGRAGRAIPIGIETAQVIERWEEKRVAMRLDAKHDGWLFPPSTAGRKDAGMHFSVNNLARSVEKLVALIPRLESDVPDRDRQSYAAFEGRVEAYSFRHAYVQRHADAGADPGALKELMDHRSIETTMGYFEVSAKRKREAVALVAPMALNYRGDPAPIDSPAAYEMASVAVPFGSCTDPTNVKAGGHACPIRFKCAGCELYRPDPSYLPAIEEHLKQLRASLTMVAMAGTAAPWVLEAQREEIASYDLIVRRLRERLAALPDDERDAIGDAGVALRRARANRPLIPLTVK